MNWIVLDGSVALSWVLPDEFTATTQSVQSEIQGGARTIVPSHWTLEVANALWMAERRKRISPIDTAAAITTLQKIVSDTDDQTAQRAASETLVLARQHALSVYDAAYLELALRTGATLASLDEALRQAAKKMRVAVLPKERS